MFSEQNVIETEAPHDTVADPGFEWGPGAVSRLKCEHDKWCDREALAFLGGSGGMLPGNFENRDAQICVFSPFGSIFEPE